TTGTYTISVSGATSPKFRIDSGAGVFGDAMANALAFYQVHRDGPNFIHSPLRGAAAHLNDQNAMTYLTPKVDSNGGFQGDLTPLGKRVDASGGWMDAGDYLKFLETENYTAAILLMGVRDFSPQLGSGFTAETKFITAWLLRMWDASTSTLYSQVG